MKQIRKTYRGIPPELLFSEVKDFVLKQGTVPGEIKQETYAQPNNSSNFMHRGTMVFKTLDGEKECIRAHILGADKGETRLILDIDESLFPGEKIAAFQSDLDFIFGSYELTK